MKNNSFMFFLNITLGLLLLGSIAFSYIFGNFGGISIKELNDGYLPKKELRFSDLPVELRKRYINKDKFNSSKKSSIERVFDDDGNPLVEDIGDFQKVIVSLQDRVGFLEKENIILSTEKSELLKIVAYEKSKNSTEQRTLLSNNLEKINEAEQQHYKNISELTRKINDLQRENIKLSQKINQTNEESKDKLKVLKQKVEDEKRALKQRKEELDKIYEIKIASVNSENDTQKKTIENLKKRLKSSSSSMVLELGKKDQRITLLQNKVNEMMLEKNNLLTTKSQIIMKLERENGKKLQEFNDIVKNSTKEKDVIKEEYNKTLKKVQKKYATLLESKEDEIKELSKKLSLEKQNSITVLNNSEKFILQKKQEADLKVENIIKISQNKIDNLKVKIANLEKELTYIKSNDKKLAAQLESKDLSISLDSDKILQLQDKIKTLEKAQRSIDDEVDELVKINEEKHNKNYKILNQKISMLELDMKSKQKLNNKVLITLNNEKSELTQKVNFLYDENRKKKRAIKDLNSDISKLQKSKNELKMSENEKLLAIRKSFDELKASMDLREKEYKAQIITLKNEISHKDTKLEQEEKNRKKLGKYIREITALKKTIKELDSHKKLAKAGDKLTLLGNVECADMISGNFKISSTCKAKVDKFLNKYDKTHYFEVIPIIGTGGFASLNKVQRDGSLGIPDSEIKRLTRLSNIGLGRDRAKEGGWLIRDKFGDDVKISYTVYSIEAKNKRGFVIRAYR